MNKHTPGPWGFLNQKDGEVLLSFGVASKEEMLDRSRFGWYSLWCGIKAEDARLIAAAPELLAAIEQLVSVFAESGMYDDEVFDDARAAIAKARGEP